MDSLAPSNVPLYTTEAERRDVWERCEARRLPVVAIRDARRGFVVRYDLQHLDRELTSRALQQLRDSVMRHRTHEPPRADAVSQVERIGGETGPVAGELHEETEKAARLLASYVAETLFDPASWQ